MVWGNLIALPFMATASNFIDGTTVITHSLENISWTAIASIAYVVYVSTHLGYRIWGTLIKMYPTSSVVPYTLIIHVVGFLSSAL